MTEAIQSIAIIHQNRPQQTFRVGYDMQAAPLSAGERGQQVHYAGVKSRLYGGGAEPSPASLPARRVVAVKRSMKPADPLPVIVSRNGGLPATPHVRDYLMVGADVVHPLPGPTAWRSIVSEVCIAHGVSYLELCSVRRDRSIVAARHEAAYRLYNETAMSRPQIGNKLGGKDHTTILHGIRCHEAKMRGEVYRRPKYGQRATA